MNLKGTVYWDVFTDIWGLFKKYVDGQKSDEYWQNVTDGARALGKKYADTPQYQFAKDLIFSILSELERSDVRKTDNKKQSDNKTARANTLTSKKGSEFYGKE